MSASMYALGPQDVNDAARTVAKRWGWYLLAGLAITVLGILLLANVSNAARTIAILVGLALIVEAIEEFVTAGRYSPTWPGYVLGVVYLVTAGLALAWPGITLWILAVVVGLGFLVGGISQLVFAIRNHHDLPNRWAFLVLGVISTLVGILALAWPGATILVLAILLGIRVLISGVTLIAFSLGLRKLTQA